MLLYKYCTENVYEDHLRCGRIRLGTQALYRAEYENGYGDRSEGASQTHAPGGYYQYGNPLHLIGRRYGIDFIGCDFPEGAVRISEEKWNAHILSFAQTYSREDHIRWFNRKGCGYNMCVVYHHDGVRNAFSRVLRDSLRSFVCGKVNYRNMNNIATIKSDPAEFTRMGKAKYFCKDKGFEWEKEYRFAIPLEDLTEETPWILTCGTFSEAIADVIRLQ